MRRVAVCSRRARRQGVALDGDGYTGGSHRHIYDATEGKVPKMRVCSW
jgi:hypothetical protein